MKKINYLVFALFLGLSVSLSSCSKDDDNTVPTPPTPDAVSDLFISEYSEGSANNKYIEIYNGTGAAVDLTNYQLQLAANGHDWIVANNLVLEGSIADKAVYVVCTDAASDVIKAAADKQLAYPSVAHFNGDDAVALAKKNAAGTFVIVDLIGDPTTDPGSGWTVGDVTDATKDHTLIRKATVKAPNATWTETEWDVKEKDDVTNLGSHTIN